MNKGIARIAGVLYLVNIVTGIFTLAYVPSQITVHGDVAATIRNIVAHESLFRFGILAGAVCYTAFLLLPLALYKLLRPIDKNAAILMVTLAVVSVPISFITLLNKLDVLSLLSGAADLQGLTTGQLHEQVMLSLNTSGNGMLVSEIFWGLWLLPFGYLVLKSGFLPKILGILLIIGGFGYLIDFLGNLLLADYTKTAMASFAILPASVGEIGTCLWLLIMGAREPVSPVQSVGTSA